MTKTEIEKQKQKQKLKEEVYYNLVNSISYWKYKFEPTREEREELINLIKNW